MTGPQVLGIFAEVDAAVQAVEALRKAELKDLEVYTPFPQHDLEHALHVHESPVRLFTLVGGLTGAATGFALTTWTSFNWPLIAGGKPMVSMPPFVVIAFELTILFGAISTLLGIIINARLGRDAPGVIYDPSFATNRFGVLAMPPVGREREARRILEASGAEEVQEAPGEAANA